MTPDIPLSRAMHDVRLFGDVFASPSFWTWKTIAKLIDGIPLTEPREIELFRQCTGRTTLPTGPVRRWFILVGRRGGKDRFQSAVAVWRAALCTDWRRHISVGEQAVVILLGADKKQGSILSKYCCGLLATPALAAEITRQTAEVIEFRNGSSLEISTNDARLVRGRSAIAVLGSECCHWRVDEHSASSDEEVVSAAEPSMAMTPDGGIMLLGSSVHRKKGLMYRKWKALFGNDDAEDLVWLAPSAVMNPKLPISVVEKALAADSAKAGAEYLGRWREDLDDFLPLDVIESANDRGIYERPPQSGIGYIAYCDPAGGTGSDSFTLAIGHRESSYVIDAVRERKPRFVPAQVIAEFAVLLKSYRITNVVGDKFAGGFHSSEWASHGITFVPSETTTSENYLASLPLFLAGRVRLVDHATLRSQLGSLERHVGPAGGREQVSHPQHAGAHDDVATSVAGALSLLSAKSYYDSAMERAAWGGGPDDPDGCRAWDAMRLAEHIWRYS